MVDRFHLQKNFAEALEKFFRKQEQALKTATQSSAGKTRSAARTKVPEKIAQERRARHHQRVSIHKQIWKLYRQGYHKEQIAQLLGVSSRRVSIVPSNRKRPHLRDDDLALLLSLIPTCST